jgi:hypothetical protein
MRQRDRERFLNLYLRLGEEPPDLGYSQVIAPARLRE